MSAAAIECHEMTGRADPNILKHFRGGILPAGVEEKQYHDERNLTLTHARLGCLGKLKFSGTGLQRINYPGVGKELFTVV